MKNKKFIESDFIEEKKEIIHQNKMVLQNSDWEHKMINKGWAYVPKLNEPVPTFVFASPERQAIIARENDIYLKNRKRKRKHDMKLLDSEL